MWMNRNIYRQIYYKLGKFYLKLVFLELCEQIEYF